MEKFYLIDLKVYKDERGSLIPFELNKNCPFDIKRTFVIYDMPHGSIRANHINKNSKLVIIALKGSFVTDCEYNSKKQTFIMNSPEKGLFIDTSVFRKLYNFSLDAVILCLSDKYYDREEYK